VFVFYIRCERRACVRLVNKGTVYRFRMSEKKDSKLEAHKKFVVQYHLPKLQYKAMPAWYKKVQTARKQLPDLNKVCLYLFLVVCCS